MFFCKEYLLSMYNIHTLEISTNKRRRKKTISVMKIRYKIIIHIYFNEYAEIIIKIQSWEINKIGR